MLYLIGAPIFLVFITLAICHIRYPFFYKMKAYQKWSVGTGKAASIHPGIVPQSVIDFKTVSDTISGEYIADPFATEKDGTFYLFVEHVINDIGKISYFTSPDYEKWEFGKVVIDEPFHLSYPFLIKKEGSYYMMPESRQSNYVKLYKATNFPDEWELHKNLIEGQYRDATLVCHNDLCYIFAADKQYRLRCFVADKFDGDYKEHPCSPLGIGNCMRPAGSAIIQENAILLPVQNRKKGYGYAINTLKITNLTQKTIKIQKQGEFIKNINHKLFNDGNHHVGHFNINGTVYYTLDGRIGTRRSYWRRNFKNSIRDNVYDLLTAVGRPSHIAFFD